MLLLVSDHATLDDGTMERFFASPEAWPTLRYLAAR